MKKVIEEIAELLPQRDENLVLVESCTAGAIAAMFGRIAGISKCLCGSSVVYQSKIKEKWLGIKKKDLKKFTAESEEMACKLAVAVLKKTPSAKWSVSVVGHLGPDAPKEKDGLIHIVVARRKHNGEIKVKKVKDYTCTKKKRAERQTEAAEAALQIFGNVLVRNHDGKGEKS